MYLEYDNLLAMIPEKELINLTNDTSAPVQSVNMTVVNNCAEFADELINASVRKRYILPLKFIPFFIKNLSCDITAYRIYSRRPNKVPEAVKENYDKALKILDKIGSGALELDLPAEHPEEDVAPAANMVRVNKTFRDRKFSDRDWSNFKC